MHSLEKILFRKNLEAREEARINDMVANVVDKMQKDPKQNIVIIAGSAHTPALRYMLQEILPQAKIKCALTISEQGIRQAMPSHTGKKSLRESFEYVISTRDDYVQNSTKYGAALEQHQEYGDILKNDGDNFVYFHPDFEKEMAGAFAPSPSPKQTQATKGQDNSQGNSPTN